MTHGPVMLDLQGLALSSEDKERLLHPATGGVILFSRNYESPQQLHRLIAEIHELRRPQLLVAVDQEGGRVQRFRDGFTRLPPAAWYGQVYARQHRRGLQVAQEAGWLMASELRACGVDFSFAPVLDLDLGLSGVIGDRAFAADPDHVGALSFAWAHGAREAGMASVGKHYPGHGGVREDSHHELPVDERSLDAIWNQDIRPFHHLIENGLEGIMPAHVIYRQVDERPAGFSSRWLQSLLREELDFQGVIFSDDLSMAAAHVAGSYADRARLALEAGCDMILVCNDPAGADQVLDALGDYHDPVAQARLVRLHGRHHYAALDQLHEMPRWHDAVQLLAAAEGDLADRELELG
jgi:beta-N-acetylhexosaminidase